MASDLQHATYLQHLAFQQQQNQIAQFQFAQLQAAQMELQRQQAELHERAEQQERQRAFLEQNNQMVWRAEQASLDAIRRFSAGQINSLPTATGHSSRGHGRNMSTSSNYSSHSNLSGRTGDDDLLEDEESVRGNPLAESALARRRKRSSLQPPNAPLSASLAHVGHPNEKGSVGMGLPSSFGTQNASTVSSSHTGKGIGHHHKRSSSSSHSVSFSETTGRIIPNRSWSSATSSGSSPRQAPALILSKPGEAYPSPSPSPPLPNEINKFEEGARAYNANIQKTEVGKPARARRISVTTTPTTASLATFSSPVENPSITSRPALNANLLSRRRTSGHQGLEAVLSSPDPAAPAVNISTNLSSSVLSPFAPSFSPPKSSSFLPTSMSDPTLSLPGRNGSPPTSYSAGGFSMNNKQAYAIRQPKGPPNVSDEEMKDKHNFGQRKRVSAVKLLLSGIGERGVGMRRVSAGI